MSFDQFPSETAQAVRRWLKRTGFPEADVIGYRINHRANEVPTIELEMIFDDRPAEEDHRPYPAESHAFNIDREE